MYDDNEDEIEAVLGPIDALDYKMAAVVKDNSVQANSKENWIYIGADPDTPNRAKIGITTGTLGTRAGGTSNPEYDLLRGIKIKEGVSDSQLKKMEKNLFKTLGESYERHPHRRSGKKSEWFGVAPLEAIKVVEELLQTNHSSQVHGYYCPERDLQVSYSWENEGFKREFEGTGTYDHAKRAPYKATDNSNPPPPLACINPSSCAGDCTCWPQ